MATIQGVYVALFGRPADPAGLAYFNGITNNGANLSSIASLAGTAEYQARFANQNNVSIVNSIYQSLFGRDAEAAGLNFFVDALNKGTLNINNVAIAILDGAQGNDKTIVTNKVAAADLYTKSIDTPAEIGSYTGNAAAAQGRAFISGVTTTVPNQAAVDTAVAAMVTAGNSGNTVTFAADGEVSLTVGAGTPAVTTTDRNDTINTVNFLSANTKIDGGLGVDTVRGQIGSAFALNTATAQNIKNVEALVLESVGNNTLTVTDVNGLQSIVADNSVVAGDNGNLTVTGVNLSTAVGLVGAQATGTTATFNFKDSTGLNDAATVTLNGATGTVAVGGAGGGAVETINVQNVGTSTATINDTAARALTVSGSGVLNMTGPASVESINASAFGGNLTTNLSAAAAVKSFVGGTGIDTVTTDTSHTGDQTFSLGAGNDFITVLADRAAAAGTGTGGTYVAGALTTNASNQAITLTGGEGADTFQFGNNSANIAARAEGQAAVTSDANGAVGNVVQVDTVANLSKSLITITDFNKAADVILVSDGVTTGGGRQTIASTVVDNIKATSTSLLDAVTKVAAVTDLNKVAVFNFGSDAYVFVNSGTTALEAGDTLIKVTGIQDTDLTATNFQIL